MNFGDALIALKDFHRVARHGWNGKGMFLVYVPGSNVESFYHNSPYRDVGGMNGGIINPHIDMKTATGEFQPGWLASQTDMLAEDWEIV